MKILILQVVNHPHDIEYFIGLDVKESNCFNIPKIYYIKEENGYCLSIDMFNNDFIIKNKETVYLPYLNDGDNKITIEDINYDLLKKNLTDDKLSPCRRFYDENFKNELSYDSEDADTQ